MASVDYLFTQNTVIKDTNIAVTVDGLSYSELLSELTNQPYIFDEMSVFANSSSQSTQIVQKIKKTQSGESFESLESPKLDPIQIQFVINKIKLDFIPSPINKLRYTVKANESVSLWFFYRTKSLFNYKPKLENIIVPEVVNNNEVSNINIVKMKKQIEVPMVSLVQKNIKRKSIKEIVKSKSKLRNITQISETEVFGAFDDSDFKKIV
jgi:hypothetical protein